MRLHFSIIMISSALSYVLTAFIIIYGVLYILSTRKFNYWKLKNVPYAKPVPIFGNYTEYILLRKYIGHVIQNICHQFPNSPYFGAFYGTEPTLIVQDPEMIKTIMTKDFYYFSSREISNHTHKEVTTQNLFFTYGDRWKVLRQNSTPLFSSSKMRNMFYLIDKCAEQFKKVLDKQVGSERKELEIKSLLTGYTIDVISSCAFGVNANAMSEDSRSNNVFRAIAESILEISNVRALKFITRAIWPTLFYGLGFKVFPTEIDKFFSKLLQEIFQGRDFKPSSRNDFVDLVLTFKEHKYITGDSLANVKGGDNKKISMEADEDLLISQCVVFFAAGFETSASTLSFTLYELAKNENIQNKAIAEVDEYLNRHKGVMSYDTLSELTYLDACIDEAMRLYPVLGVLTRELYDDYTFPNGLQLEKGMRVHIPVYHLHHNPEFFPEPELFRPDRFLPEFKRNIKPYVYLPFGEGPRICIGMRFAKMNMLSALVTLLQKYRFELGQNTPKKLEFEPKAIVTQAAGGINLAFVPRDTLVKI